MHKTSVYLTEEEVESLRRAADATGITRSELIREGIRQVVAVHRRQRPTFHSMGRGRGDVNAPRRWTSRELYEKTQGRR